MRGATDSIEVQPAASIGDLRRVVVRQLQPGSCQSGAGWFLEQVLVTGPGGQQWRFPCGAWLGKSDAGDRVGALPQSLHSRSAVLREAGRVAASEVWPLLTRIMRVSQTGAVVLNGPVLFGINPMR